MAIDKENLIRRIDELIDLATKAYNLSSSEHNEVVSGTITILEQLYSRDSHKTKAFLEQHASCFKQKESKQHALRDLAYSTKGILQSIKSEVDAGLVGNIQRQAQGGIFCDFLSSAKNSLDENKDVAAVLACAALEDALKRYAEQQVLSVSDSDMSQVINALKSQSLLKDPQASIVQSYVKLRNKAFHAEWDKIEKESVSSAIGFTETFILEHFI